MPILASARAAPSKAAANIVVLSIPMIVLALPEPATTPEVFGRTMPDAGVPWGAELV
jgi:hypothetical protein